MKATPPNRGTKQKQTKPTAVPSGAASRSFAAKRGDPRAASGGKVLDVAKGGSYAGAKKAPGLYDTSGSYSGNRGTGSGKGKQANFRRS